MLERIIAKLDENKIQDYEISNKPSVDNISITTDLRNLTVYFPEDCEYDVYSVESFLRDLNPLFRPSTRLDRNIYVMNISRPLTEFQYYKLIKEIIDLNDFCTIIDR